jgi:putative flavoprotein involved in K+ transport
VMESIKDDIDRHIARAGIDAPTEPRYVPVWRPEREETGLDLAEAGITSIVWAAGYRSDYSWVQVGAFDGSGHPMHQRGSSAVAGLHFLGLPWLHTWGSGRFAAIARDAEHLADRIEEGAADRTPAGVGAAWSG